MPKISEIDSKSNERPSIERDKIRKIHKSKLSPKISMKKIKISKSRDGSKGEPIKHSSKGDRRDVSPFSSSHNFIIARSKQ